MSHGSGTVAHTAKQWCHTWWARGFLRKDVMAAILKVWRHILNPTLIHLRNNPTKFHPGPTWNDRTLCFSGRDRPNTNKKHKYKTSSDTVSVPVPDSKI